MSIGHAAVAELAISAPGSTSGKPPRKRSITASTDEQGAVQGDVHSIARGDATLIAELR